MKKNFRKLKGIETRLKNGTLLEIKETFDKKSEKTFYAVHILVDKDKWVRCSQWYQLYGNAENTLIYYLTIDAIEPYGRVYYGGIYG